jgi:hypothetical protein
MTEEIRIKGKTQNIIMLKMAEENESMRLIFRVYQPVSYGW